MPKRMLIDASHPEETRVVVLDGNKVEEFDFESASRRPLKGNIYLAKVTRVEPSLQAAFVEYGGNRQGFLAFSEIHPDYYQIPVADRIALLAAQTQRMMADDEDGFDAVDTATVPRGQPMPGMEADDEDAPQGNGEEHAGDEHEAAGDEEERADEDDDGPENDTAHRDESGGETHEATPPESVDTGAPPSSGEAGTSEANESIVQQQEDSLATQETHASDSAAATAQEAQAETHEIQAETTDAPVQQQRRGPRQNWPRPPRRRQYKIQEVIKRRQILLVQVVKEERGTKGASLTTFLSLAGRYCVLMPNTPRGGGISRKITNAVDRKRLKSAAQSLELPEGMGLIIRTAGANRTKLEIKRDYEYLLRLWDTVRELTLNSNAPALVYEEGSLIKRAIRDLYNKDISEVQVDGDAGYRDAKDFMRMIMPSHAKNVKPYKEPLPLFQRFQVEAQLDAMFSPTVTLRSGGYIVINQTEALVSIDVNSGKATREHSIEETAHKTNLEAADEIGRQLRLRDLAGLIVIDFIDMEDGKNDRNVEKRLHNAVKGDRARIQIGKISQFGLLEMSRQRLRAGVVAGSTVTCPHCAGLGIIRSTESAALKLLRALDDEGQRAPGSILKVKAPEDVCIYTLNHKRREIARIEEAYDLQVSFEPQAAMMGGSSELERIGMRPPSSRPKSAPVSLEAGFPASEPEPTPPQEDEEEHSDEEVAEQQAAPSPQRPHERPQQGDAGDGKRKRRRRRRGGRGRNESHLPQEGANGGRDAGRGQQQHRPPMVRTETEVNVDEANETAEDSNPSHDVEGQHNGAPTHGLQPPLDGGDRKRRRRRRGRRGRNRDGEQGVVTRPSGEESRATIANDDGPREEAETSFPAIRHEESFDQETVAPNSPSSPQWSLTDRASGTEAATIEPMSQIAPETTRAEVQARVTAEPAQPEAESSGDSRKGWWQRRFRI